MLDKLKKMNLSSIAGVLLILVVLPLGALYYMNLGLEWRLERLSELKDYSRISEQQLHTAYDSLADIFMEEKNIIVTTFLNPESRELTSLFGENLRKLHEQFDARDDVFFLAHVLEGAGDGEAFISSFRETYGLEDKEQCFFFLQDEQQLAILANEAYKIEREDGEDWLSNFYFALVDEKVVRSYYDVQEPEAIKKLVEHIAILIPPRKEREDLIFKREVEK